MFGEEIPDSKVEKAPPGKSLRDMTRLAEKEAAQQETPEKEVKPGVDSGEKQKEGNK